MATEKRQPRPFQRRVRDILIAGKNVILQAPTGAGKTDAALWPFLQNLEQGGVALPRTCLYATPMRVLSSQFYKQYRERIAHIDKVSGTDLTRPYKLLGRDPVSIQTGDQSDNPQFESILTFCTIDQLLASFLAVPYGVGQRKANLNVGAVASSYLVLDEFHLYPLLRGDKSVFGARTTAIQMLRLLKSITPFVLMTATFSSTLLTQLAELLDAEIVTVNNPQELQEIAQGRTRVFQRSPDSLPMDADTILAEHNQRSHNKCTLVICNTVLRAQQMFLQLHKAQAQETRVILLHSRLSSEDRKRLSAEVEHDLGPRKWDNGTYRGRDIIVVATQVVEVGLDISVQVLHTENAPANSLIQRAGRCARFAGQQGIVIVYPLPKNEEGKEVTTLPYDKDICQQTWNALEQFNKQQVGFQEEQVLINAVHTKGDEDLLNRYNLQEEEILKRIFESFNTNRRGVASVLIRDVSQVQILIHDNPDEAITEEPWRWQSFGMHPASLAGRWHALEERKSSLGPELDWLCKQAILIPETDEADNQQKAKYRWEPIASSGNTDQMTRTLSEALMIVLPSKIATYDKELGFILLDDRLQSPSIETTPYQSNFLQRKKTSDRKSEAQKQQSYQEHIAGLVQAYNVDIRHSTRYVRHRLEQLLALQEGIIDQAIRLAIACHDLGKLDQMWQQWAREWQTLIMRNLGIPYRPPGSDFFFAKTTYGVRPEEEHAWKKEMQAKKPNHACESASLSIDLIAHSLGVTDSQSRHIPVLRAVCGAIAHHHTPQSHKFGSTHLISGAISAAAEALEESRQDGQWKYNLSHLAVTLEEGGNLIPTNDPDPLLTVPKQGYVLELETWIYFVIVRALRLADQRAGAFGLTHHH